LTMRPTTGPFPDSTEGGSINTTDSLKIGSPISGRATRKSGLSSLASSLGFSCVASADVLLRTSKRQKVKVALKHKYPKVRWWTCNWESGLSTLRSEQRIRQLTPERTGAILARERCSRQEKAVLHLLVNIRPSTVMASYLFGIRCLNEPQPLARRRKSPSSGLGYERPTASCSMCC
jgi:hypothetical protein